MIEKLWTTCRCELSKTFKIFPFVLYYLNTEVGAGVSAMKVKAPSAKVKAPSAKVKTPSAKKKAQIPAFSPWAV
jgi:hypothetical protein